MIIDFHTHAFPDNLAGPALEKLLANSNGLPACHDGTISGLLASMDRAGIETSVIASIATKPGQFKNILEWSKEITGPRIVPLGSVHPHCPDFAHAVSKIAEEGLPGIKLHPMYQEFALDDQALYPLYEEVASRGLFLLLHAGFDIAYPGNRQAIPERILRVHRDFPQLKLIAAHLGGWNLWDEVLDKLAGKDIYLETSMVLDYCPEETLKAILARHDPTRILFGTDSPWANQALEVAGWKNMKLKEHFLEDIFSLNAKQLLAWR